MTTANSGLRSALARGASATALAAIAGMKGDDLLASLSDEQKAELSAALAPPPAPAAAADDGEGDPMCPKCKDTMKDGKCAKCGPEESASSEAAAVPLATNASIHERVKAVAADPAVKGREATALAVLADDDLAGLSAAGLVRIITLAPGQSASSDDEGAAAMLAAMRQGANFNLGSNASAQPKAEENHGWAAIHENLRNRQGR